MTFSAFQRTPNMAAGLATYSADATLFAIVSGSAESTSQVTWKLYSKARSGKIEDRTEVPPGSHPAQVIWDRPNPFHSGMLFRETGMQHFEATGEWDWVIDNSPGFPLNMWCVRPDRLHPVKDYNEYLTGWKYVFDGEEIPLTLDQVRRVIRPDPNDSYRGMAPVISALADVDTNKLAAEWSRNFFYNNAQPGGMIEYERRLTDVEFKETVQRWREQHKGVGNAHRIGIIEGGKWVDSKYSVKDMDFSALRQLSSEEIRKAYRYPKPMLGTVDDVNRANADAGEYIYGKWFIVPRLNRVRSVLNDDFLPLFGPNDASLYEFDYDPSVIPEDRVQNTAELTAKANAAKAFLDMGYDHIDVEEYLELPAMKWEKPEPPPILQVQGSGPPKPKQDAKPANLAPLTPRALWTPPRAAGQDVDPSTLPPLDETQASWDAALLELLAAWGAVTAAQAAALLVLVRDLVHHGDIAAVESWSVTTELAADTIAPALTQLSATAVQEMIAEAAAQGVDLPTVVADPVRSAQLADAYADLLGRELVLSAAGETARLYRTGVGADELAASVGDHLDSLTDARPRLYLGGALTAAQNAGRIAVLMAGPTAAYYANETLDANTCGPCEAVNGKWLGNSILRDVVKTYPTGGYVDCLGRLRCRGQVSAIWRPETAGGQ